MSSVLSVNPMQTTNARGTFYTKSDGLIQGVALDDPAARYALASGTLSNDEVKPLWGGLAVNELVPGASSAPRGSVIKRATTLSQLVGFSVFNQAHNGLTTPQSPVPLFLSNMSVSFYRLGSGMRVPVKASDAVISLASAGISVNQPLVWNFAEDCLDVFSTVAADVATTEITWTAPTANAAGFATATTASAHGLKVGGYADITGAAPAAYNGIVQVLSVPTATTFTFTPVSVPAGNATTQGTVGAAKVQDVALPVKIIEMQMGNSKTVSYDSATGFATWNDSGNAAVILL
ncbi:hypothetical protein F0422_20300 [Salmonella enterica]|uniref:Uncharacterized protein n=3 Tax=Salmonella enterica I TaxID=59201 RepID=A0A5X5TB36_SALTI|nr:MULTISPECIES: hypothetical protein [Enterobacteriaceae]EAA2010163.1 hypothetical protein [Salmonella enterica subsp. enterica serovar Give]EAP1758187.1 hypothetical protein [Salmonella enterica]EBV7970572.1 hypothetical protein [Salmonella enterica subsp. enterica serovar Uganda]ECB4844374.1 hypothetical protein [Salmonella enterica subsp. enterica serovar Liverpool]ECD5388280.1 hypothetical protein [Salmonella enterica subsp. enterica serovar Anatum]ECN7208282.1 hypothetical protein [Salm